MLRVVQVAATTERKRMRTDVWTGQARTQGCQSAPSGPACNEQSSSHFIACDNNKIGSCNGVVSTLYAMQAKCLGRHGIRTPVVRFPLSCASLGIAHYAGRSQACLRGFFGIGVIMLDTALTVSGVPGLSTPAPQPGLESRACCSQGMLEHLQPSAK